MHHTSTSSTLSVGRRADVVARRIGETAVLVHLGSNRIYELNDTGARIWELAGDGTTVEALIDRLECEFDVDRVRLADEVSLIVMDLLHEGLLEDRSSA